MPGPFITPLIFCMFASMLFTPRRNTWMKVPTPVPTPPSPEADFARHPIFKEEFNPSTHEFLESYFAARRVRPLPISPQSITVTCTGLHRSRGAPNSSVKASEVGKKQRNKERFRFAGLADVMAALSLKAGMKLRKIHPLLRTDLRLGLGLEKGGRGNGRTTIAL